MLQIKKVALWSALLISLLLLEGSERSRPLLLINAHILTMDPSQSVANTLLIKGQHIAAVGGHEEVVAIAPPDAQVIDLQGQTLLPGFVDAHSHFPSTGLAQTGLDLTPPPVGTVSTVAMLIDRVAESARTHSPGSWIIGFNYDNAALNEQRHPSRAELDAVAPDHPVYLWHRSGHMGVGNSLALAALGHTDDLPAVDSSAGKVQFKQPFISIPHTKQPHSHVERDVDGRLTGLLQEAAAPRLGTLLKQMPLDWLFNSFLLARDEYLQAGVTTVQNGYADRQSMQILLWAQRFGVLPQRVVVWPAHDKLEASPDLPANGNARYHVGAIKLIADGSPQGRTAWLTQPYLPMNAGFDKGVSADYRGHPSMPPSQFKAVVARYHEAGFQLALHGNGDASIDLIIDALSAANERAPRTDTRHIIVHAQTIRTDQLQQLQGLDISVSFFPAHTFFWGDWYRDRLLGEARARRISPLATADHYGVRYSIHSDAPVTPMSPMQMLWSATRRETLSGTILDSSLAISRERALRAMTIDAAWQNHLDSDRGSLEAGKLADVIVLSGNPLTEPDVRKLRVQRVWIGGREVY
ncbi:MAG: amidohydrolase [Granulosicoccus sp.]